MMLHISFVTMCKSSKNEKTGQIHSTNAPFLSVNLLLDKNFLSLSRSLDDIDTL
jgi:hypothetical protein